MTLKDLSKISYSQKGKEELNQWIEGIDDEFIRQILNLRFVQGKTWLDISLDLGGISGPDCLRMMVKRFLAQQVDIKINNLNRFKNEAIKLIERYGEKHKLAKSDGGQYIIKNICAQKEAIVLVCDIFDLYKEKFG